MLSFFLYPTFDLHLWDPSLPTPGDHHSATPCCFELSLFRFCMWDHAVGIYLPQALFSSHDVLQVCPPCHRRQDRLSSLSSHLLRDAQTDSTLALVNFAAVSMAVQTTLTSTGYRHTAFICSEHGSSSGTSRAYGGSIFNFGDNYRKSFSTMTALFSKPFLGSFTSYFIQIALNKYPLNFYYASEVLFEMLSG